jgi:transposase
VLAVIADGLSISQVAGKVGVSRQTLHSWLARYEAGSLEGLVDRSHRPVSCPHQMPARGRKPNPSLPALSRQAELSIPAQARRDDWSASRLVRYLASSRELGTAVRSRL